jgi:hypothetical protein
MVHGKTDVFLEDSTKDAKEAEADRFAEDLLIPPSDWIAFVERGCFAETDIIRFARRVGIAPCFVVGRLQHERRVSFSSLTHLKPRLQWKS